MAKVLVSLPDEVLKKIDEYRNKKGLKRNQFFINATNTLFRIEQRNAYFARKRKAVESIKKTSEEIMKLGIKDWDPVKEIRKARDERTNELLKRLEGE